MTLATEATNALACADTAAAAWLVGRAATVAPWAGSRKYYLCDLVPVEVLRSRRVQSVLAALHRDGFVVLSRNDLCGPEDYQRRQDSAVPLDPGGDLDGAMAWHFLDLTRPGPMQWQVG